MTTGLPEKEAAKALDEVVKAVKPGKRVVVNQSVPGQRQNEKGIPWIC